MNFYCRIYQSSQFIINIPLIDAEKQCLMNSTVYFTKDFIHEAFEEKKKRCHQVHCFLQKMFQFIVKCFSVTTSTSESTSSSDFFLEPQHSGQIELGNYELIGPKISPEELRSQPVIYHGKLPVFSIHQNTVQTENALEHLVNAPESLLIKVAPPTVVDDNYCFIVDASCVGMKDIMKDEQFWRHTSRPVQYYYSADLRSFLKVSCIKAKGRVIAAKLLDSRNQVLSPTPPGSDTAARLTPSSTSQNLSLSNVHPSTSSIPSKYNNQDEKVPLNQVYMVTRFYSFWKTFPSFHRIVTVLDHVQQVVEGKTDLSKRLFVQYVWRDTKESDKMRVKREYESHQKKVKERSNNIARGQQRIQRLPLQKFVSRLSADKIPATNTQQKTSRDAMTSSKHHMISKGGGPFSSITKRNMMKSSKINIKKDNSSIRS